MTTPDPTPTERVPQTADLSAMAWGGAQSHDLGPGDRIGQYRLVSLLGQGGYGLVYLADQEGSLQRQVALKIIKPGMDTRQVIARFQQERQTLALMNHPCVARIYEAGATPAGRPYFVMEYVRGDSITSFCDARRLSTVERLDLFLQVCDGVQYAHQKGIIHRDLKPSNVLVSMEESSPAPKIIDFGVARAITRSTEERSMHTEVGQIIGTPEYMSPEQAELPPEELDTRTDIYSLGTILYELLVGQRPFESKVLRRGGSEEMKRAIRESQPIRPSTRLIKQRDASTRIARYRRTDMRSLARMLKGDLDWIVLRAMEKDRTRRYASASELAADIRRHLRNEPVLAGPPKASYRIGKFVRRNWGWVSASVAAVLALLVFVGVLGVKNFELTRARNDLQRSVTRERDARESADKSRSEAEERSEQLRISRDDLARSSQLLSAQAVMAETARSAAEYQAQRALIAEQAALDAKARAEDAQRLAERRAYLRDISSANDALARGDFGAASRHLMLAQTQGVGWELEYLEWAMDRSHHMARLPLAGLGAVAFGWDGETLIAGGAQGDILLFDVVSDAEVMRVRSPGGRPIALANSGDGRYVGALSADGAVTVLDLPMRHVVRTFPAGGPGASALAMSRAGDALAIGGWDGSIRLRDPRTGEPLGSWSPDRAGASGAIVGLAFTPDGTMLAAGGADGLVRLLATDPPRELGTLPAHASPVRALAFGADGELLATGAEDGQIVLWEIRDSQVSSLGTFEGHLGEVLSLRFSLDGSILLSASADRSVALWDAAGGGQLIRMGGPTEPMLSAAFGGSAASTTVRAVSQNGEVRTWRMDRLDPTGSGRYAQGSRITHLAVMADGASLVAVGADGSARVRDSGSMAPAGPPAAHEAPVRSLGAGGERIATLDAAGTLRLWDATMQRVDSTMVLGSSAEALALDASGRRMIVGDSAGWIRSLDPESGQEHGRIHALQASIASLALCADGTRAVAAGEHTAAIVGIGRLLVDDTIDLGTSWSAAVAIAPDGARAAIATTEGTVVLWSDEAAASRVVPSAGSGRPTSLAFTPDGDRLAVGDSAGAIRLVDTQTGDEAIRVRPGGAPVEGLAFHPDSGVLFAAIADGSVVTYGPGNAEPVPPAAFGANAWIADAFVANERGEAASPTSGRPFTLMVQVHARGMAGRVFRIRREIAGLAWESEVAIPEGRDGAVSIAMDARGAWTIPSAGDYMAAIAIEPVEPTPESSTMDNSMSFIVHVREARD
ncbi:MAG: protein kinase [Phycisphaeraceae bacterium]|nr:protein kinase [Phycisphaeraceae bacterium]